MTSKLKVNILADGGDNAIMTSDGSGSLTLNNASLKSTPAFLCTNGGSGQTLSSATWTKITDFSETYDTDSAFTDNRFTVPSGSAGKYFIYGGMKITTTSARRGVIAIYKNGSSIIAGGQVTDYYSGPRVSGAIELAVGDYVELYGKIDDGGGGTIGTDSAEDIFGAYRLIGA